MNCIKNRSENFTLSDAFNDLHPLENAVITESLSLSSLHPAGLESYRQKPIVIVSQKMKKQNLIGKNGLRRAMPLTHLIKCKF